MFPLTKAERATKPLRDAEIVNLIAKYGDEVDGHALFAPSAAPMWLRCPGSLLLRASTGDNAGIDAAMGTVAHWVAETWAKAGERPEWLVGVSRVATAGGNRYEFTIDDEMLNYVGLFVEWCAEVPGDHYYEQKIDLSPFLPIGDQTGTADHFACEFGILTITDLKYGTGVRVYAEKNYQALCYALGVFHEWDWIYGFQRIVIRICHPRLDVFDSWEISRADLIEFGEFVRARSLIAFREDAARTPSAKACQWCQGRTTCPARVRELDRIIDETIDDLEEEDRDEPAYEPPDLTPEAALMAGLASLPAKVRQPVQPFSTAALSLTYTLRRHVETWFRAIGEELLARAEAGETLPHQKLMDGRSKQVWKDEAEAARFIMNKWEIPRAEIRPPVMVTPNKARAIIRKKTKEKPVAINSALAPLIAKHAGRRSLAPINDERVDSFTLAEDAADEGEDDDDF